VGVRRAHLARELQKQQMALFKGVPWVK